MIISLHNFLDYDGFMLFSKTFVWKWMQKTWWEFELGSIFTIGADNCHTTRSVLCNKVPLLAFWSPTLKVESVIRVQMPHNVRSSLSHKIRSRKAWINLFYPLPLVTLNPSDLKAVFLCLEGRRFEILHIFFFNVTSRIFRPTDAKQKKKSC